MKKTVVFIIVFAVIFTGCTDTKSRSKGVYVLLDTSDSSALELKNAQSILYYLLGTLQPMDSLAAASIDTGSFSEEDIIAKVTFYQRPSVTNNQKRAFQRKIDQFISVVKSPRYSDISGGILQAIEYLNEVDPGKKYILIFSDLNEEIKKGHVREVSFQLAGFHIIALNVSKLIADIDNTKKYLERVVQWREKVEAGNGKWRFINNLKQLENIFTNCPPTSSRQS
jgi:hypothetical protein